MTSSLAAATDYDLDLALAFFAVLGRRAQSGKTITYKELVDEAKAMFPDDTSVQTAIPVSARRRLNFIRAFTEEQRWPDITALVVSKAAGDVGAGFDGSMSPEEARQRIFGFNWAEVSGEFTGAISLKRSDVQPKKLKPSPTPKPMSYDQAATIMHNHYMANKASLPASVRTAREKIIELIRGGRTVEQAFAEARL